MPADAQKDAHLWDAAAEPAEPATPETELDAAHVAGEKAATAETELDAQADVDEDVQAVLGSAPPTGINVDIEYADDTALISDNIPRLQVVLERLLYRASMYGLEPNWSKTVHLQVRHNVNVVTPQGAIIKPENSAIYLDSVLKADGSTGASIARRLGEAAAAFKPCRVFGSMRTSRAPGKGKL